MMTQPGFLNGGGEMAERIRTYDWISTPLGPLDHWPANLRTTLGIVLNCSFPMFLFWGDDLTCFYNDAFRPSLGVDGKHPMIGKSGREGWADIWDTIGKLLDGVRKSGKATQFEDLLVPFFRNGRTEDTYWTFSYSPILGESGGVDGILVTCVETTEKVHTLQQLAESETRLSLDITEQVRILEQVRNSELDLRNIVLKAPIGICILDASTLVAEIVNNSFVQVAGKPHDAIAGKYYWDAFPEARQYYEDPLSSVAREGKTFVADEVELMLIRNGSPEMVFVTFVYAPVVDLAGNVKKVAVWVQENTTQVSTRRRLQEAEKKAILAITSANLGVYEIEYAADTMLTDRRFKAIWGVDDPNFSRSDYVRHIHPDDRHDREIAHRRSLQTGHLDYIARIFWPDGTLRWVRITGTVLYDEHTQPTKLIGIAQDITDTVLARRKIEEAIADRTRELATANEQLQQSNAELSQFAYIASHDLQEPIRKISIYAGLLKEQHDPVPAGKNYLEKIISATIRMQNLIRGVLDYSELSRSAPAFERVDLNRIIKDILVEFELLIEQKQARIHFQPLPVIDAVPIQMTQLFSNLISNALKYSRPETSPVMDLTCRLEDTRYHLQIDDNGIGFAQEHAEQIFSIFKRLHRKNDYSGTGIGLAMCKRILDNHHGEIYAVGRPGRGATFHIMLPA